MVAGTVGPFLAGWECCSGVRPPAVELLCGPGGGSHERPQHGGRPRYGPEHVRPGRAAADRWPADSQTPGRGATSTVALLLPCIVVFQPTGKGIADDPGAGDYDALVPGRRLHADVVADVADHGAGGLADRTVAGGQAAVAADGLCGWVCWLAGGVRWRRPARSAPCCCWPACSPWRPRSACSCWPGRRPRRYPFASGRCPIRCAGCGNDFSGWVATVRSPGWPSTTAWAPTWAWWGRQPDGAAGAPERRARLALEQAGGMFVKLGQMLSTRPDVVPQHWPTSWSGCRSRWPRRSGRHPRPGGAGAGRTDGCGLCRL